MADEIAHHQLVFLKRVADENPAGWIVNDIKIVNVSAFSRPICPGSVVVPRGFTAAPEQRFRVIARRNGFLTVRLMDASTSTRVDGMGPEFPIHHTEARRAPKERR